MAYAEIDYGGSVAKLWGDFTEEAVRRVFHQHANQCFGIRNSIMGFELLKFEEDTLLPAPWSKMEGAATMLKHSGDTIVWNSDGEKIKSEFD